MDGKIKLIQRDQIISYLEKHGSATVRELMINLNINSPTKRVSELVKMGYPISKAKVKRVNSSGETKYFVKYQLKGERK